MLEHNMETGPLPKDNLHIGAFRYYQEGHDYYIPILKKHGDKIKITGIGLLKRINMLVKLRKRYVCIQRTFRET